ncbi:uncharacterized protein TNCT_704561 [Trichonephila clavata]|uniref:Uncharacterized protein n=1 Tax=Trichonephila clavata TaxID=2740835 RepID=A0A8X6GJQ8_TRICU|nr:uncharacterized protein TNCT_704561 [Trichonephila clavata]
MSISLHNHSRKQEPTMLTKPKRNSLPSDFSTSQNTQKLLKEQKFARDIVLYFMSECFLGLHWEPTSNFIVKDTDSPFTTSVRRIVKDIVDTHGANIHEQYDEDFPEKDNVTKNSFRKCCINLLHPVIFNTFEIECYILMCVSLCLYAGLSYLYGLEDAPNMSRIYIAASFAISHANDDVWKQLISYCERYPLIYR